MGLGYPKRLLKGDSLKQTFASEIMALLSWTYISVEAIGTMIDLGREKKLAQLFGLCFDVNYRARRQAEQESRSPQPK